MSVVEFWKNPLNFGVDATQNGWLAASLGLCCNMYWNGPHAIWRHYI